MANPIEENDDLAQSLGRVAGRWGMVEYLVEIIFLSLIGTDYRRSTIIFSFFKSVQTQVDVIELLLDESKTLTRDETAACKKALRGYKKLSPERNALIHYPFGYDSNSTERAIYKTRNRRKGDKLHWAEPTSAAAVMDFADRVTRLYDVLSEAHKLIWLASLRTPPPQPPYPVPAIPSEPTTGQ